MMDKKCLSIIMPTCNKAAYLDITLAGFTIQDCDSFEIVIIDDGSNDSTFEVVRKYSDKCTIKYQYQENKGRSIARNTALGIAEGKYLIFNDDDRIPAPGFINAHLKALMGGPEIVSIGSKKAVLSHYSKDFADDPLRGLPYTHFLEVMGNDPRNVNRLLSKDPRQLIFPEELIRDFDGVVGAWSLPDNPLDNYNEIIAAFSAELTGFHLAWALGTTGNMALCRDQLGNATFDENYLGWGVEDTDFSYQLSLHGCKFQYTEKGLNYHQLHPRVGGEWSQVATNLFAFCKKYKRVEVYLYMQAWARYITFVQANEIMDMLLKTPGNALIRDYLRLFQSWADLRQATGVG